MAEESSSPLPFFLYPHSALPSLFFPLALSDQKEVEKWSRRFPEGNTPRRPGAVAGQKSASDARRRQRPPLSSSIASTVVLRPTSVDNVLRHRELRKCSAPNSSSSGDAPDHWASMCVWWRRRSWSARLRRPFPLNLPWLWHRLDASARNKRRSTIFVIDIRGMRPL